VTPDAKSVQRTDLATDGHVLPAQVEGLEIAVPGSIANLGPGFDALAVAISLSLHVRVRRACEGPPNTLRSDFGESRIQGENYVERAFRSLAELEGARVPALEVEIESEIPMQAGLGSSAAATVAGLRLFEAVAARRSRDLLTTAASLEGHPDNVAACLLGGLTASCTREDGRVLGLSTRWPAAVRFVAATPAVRLRTVDARSVMPDSLSRADAVFNLQRTALLLQAVHTGRLDVMREALRDRWHQPHRAALVPGLTEALAFEHPNLLGVCLSGSGPTIVALAVHEPEPIAELLGQVYSKLGLPVQIRVLDARAPMDSLEP
jgi:homoserine kinase